jgi:hypothetical protein
MFTQAPPQKVWPVGHAHALATQVRPPVHTLPQAPQLLLLLVVFTQVMLVAHQVGVPVGHVQALATQAVRGAAHARPQPPQLAGSLVVFTQVIEPLQ